MLSAKASSKSQYDGKDIVRVSIYFKLPETPHTFALWKLLFFDY